MDLKAEINRVFSPANFKRSYLITWLSIFSGFFIIFLFFIISSQMPKNGPYSFILQNLGLFFLFSSFLLAYAGTCRINTISHGASIKDSFIEITKRSHYILGISFGTAILLFVVVLIQIGISLIGYIPYAGPAVLVLLTIPFFVVNFTCLLISICVILITPPMVGEGKSISEIILNMIILLRKNWFHIILYMFISSIILIFALILVYYFTRYSVGITKALQWKINAAYSKFLNIMSASSVLTDIADKIAPNPDPIGSLKKYGFKILNYLSLVKYTISFFYIIVFSFIVSFPFAAYFNLSSVFYKWIKE